MEIKRYASATEITLKNGTTVLVSYNTPVAAFVSGRGGLVSSTRYSVTTSKHVSQFLSRHNLSRTEVDQAEIAALLEGNV